MKKLKEGINVTRTNREAALNAKDVSIGIEYEMTVMRNGEVSTQIIKYVKSVLDDINLDYADVIVEHDDQIEIITDIMTLPEGLKHLKQMFHLLKKGIGDLSFKTTSHAGLHISISVPQKSFNALKFALFMESDYIHRLFPERTHTNNMNSFVNAAIKYAYMEDPDASIPDMVEEAEKAFFEDVVQERQKYFTFKLSDYIAFDGRVELRYYGGEGYENDLPRIMDDLSRSIYLLKVAHGREFRKEYLATFARRLSSIQSKDITLSSMIKQYVDGNKALATTIANTIRSKDFRANDILSVMSDALLVDPHTIVGKLIKSKLILAFREITEDAMRNEYAVGLLNGLSLYPDLVRLITPEVLTKAVSYSLISKQVNLNDNLLGIIKDNVIPITSVDDVIVVTPMPSPSFIKDMIVPDSKFFTLINDIGEDNLGQEYTTFIDACWDKVMDVFDNNPDTALLRPLPVNNRQDRKEKRDKILDIYREWLQTENGDTRYQNVIMSLMRKLV